jgi:hypothetical protein
LEPLQSAQRFIRRVERLPSIQLRLCGMKREGDVSGFEFRVSCCNKHRDNNSIEERPKPEAQT